MGLWECCLNLDAARQELRPHGTLEFPCAGYSEQLAEKTMRDVPWHWHEELEVILVTSGTLRVQTPGAAQLLGAGDCIAVNSGVLHSAAGQPQCELHSLVFSPLLLTGSKDSVFARKYLTPLTGCRAFRAFRLDRAANGPEIGAVARAFDALARDEPGFEFAVRAALSCLCFALCRRFAGSIAAGAAPAGRDDLRMQKMLDFIAEGYTGELSLPEIAGAAGIGERECLRCFARTIQQSPMQYLLKYRVMRGAEALLRDPGGSVAEIASACGFDSPSNFSRMFRRFYDCTPREYRRAAL